MKTVIFAGGELDDPIFSRTIAHEADFVICCDSGANHAAKLGIVPDLIVGDMDSVDESTKKCYESLEVEFSAYPSEKNATDLELAVHVASQMQSAEIVILGGYGGRVDHFLSNIQVLVRAAKAGIDAFLVNSTTKSFIIHSFAEIHREDYNCISLIPISTEVKGITTTGLKYPLRNETLYIGTTVGISNEFASFVATVTLEEGLLLTVCTKCP